MTSKRPNLKMTLKRPNLKMTWKRQKWSGKDKKKLNHGYTKRSYALAVNLHLYLTVVKHDLFRWRTGDLPWSNFDWVTQDVIEIVVPGVWNSKLIQFRLPVSRQHFAERTLSKWGGSEIKRRKWGQAWINNGKKFHSWCNQSDRNITRGGSKIDGTNPLQPTSITYHGHMHLR